VQTLLGHSALRTTMIYTHVMNRPGVGVRSPLDATGRIEECTPASLYLQQSRNPKFETRRNVEGF